jgi:hypothetical protein
MLYNLPNGKTIYLTIEEYLSLTDEDIQNFIACKSGVHLSPFYDSSVDTKSKPEEEFDLDYIPDDLKDDHSLCGNANYYDEDYYEDDHDFLDPTSID